MNEIVIIDLQLAFEAYSQGAVSNEEIEIKISNVVQEKNSKGYKLLSITPLAQSETEFGEMLDGGYGLGFSFTSSLILAFEKV